MKKIVLLLVMFPFLFIACVDKMEVSKEVEEVKKESDKKYDVYSLYEYKQLDSDKKVKHEMVYTEEEFKMFNKPFTEIKGFKPDESLTLSHSYINILEVLEDRAFLKRFSSENPSTIIYEKNQMMPILFSKCGSCIGGFKYIMKLEGNILKMKILNEVVYDLANPIPCESDEER